MTERAKQSQQGGVGMVGLVVVVLVILVAVVVFVLPRLPVTFVKISRFSGCQGNLKGIGTAIFAYYQENNDLLPLIKTHEAVLNGVNSVPTEANQTDEPFSSGRWEVTLGDQAMQNVWLLVAEKFLDEEMVRCKGDRDWVERSRGADYGWTDPHQYSYGMHWPYQADASGNTNAAPLLTPNTALMADRNPGGPLGDSRPPSNHPKVGTNVLLASGGVKGCETMVSTVGTGGDEIYTNAAGVAGGLPQHEEDTSITLSGR